MRLRVPSAMAVEAVHARTVIDGEPQYTQAAIVDQEPGDDGAVWWQAQVKVGNPADVSNIIQGRYVITKWRQSS